MEYNEQLKRFETSFKIDVYNSNFTSFIANLSPKTNIVIGAADALPYVSNTDITGNTDYFKARSLNVNNLIGTCLLTPGRHGDYGEAIRYLSAYKILDIPGNYDYNSIGYRYTDLITGKYADVTLSITRFYNADGTQVTYLGSALLPYGQTMGNYPSSIVDPYFYFILATVTNGNITGMYQYNIRQYASNNHIYAAMSNAYNAAAIEWFMSLGGVVPDNLDPYGPGGASEPSGPNTGSWDIVNDDIDFPAIPTISAADSGFFSIWTPTLEQIQLLAQFMWTTDLTNIDTWKRLVANPIELILGLSLFPFDMTPDGHEPLTIGIINSRIETNYRDSQFFDIDCGTIDLEEYYGAFLDYAPYTELDIYLPYIGVRTINVNDVMPKTLHLRYRIDLVTGSCVAMLKADNSVFYHFSGSCAIQIPVTTYQMQDMIKSAISAASSIIGGIATGGVAGALAAVSGTSSAVASAGQHASRSGAIGSAAGFLSVQKPYLIITRPRQAVPQNQSTYTGYPAFITAELGDLEGYTEVEMIHLHDVPATSEELDEIERLLLEGVIF